MYFYSMETSIHGFLFSSLGQIPFWKSGASGTCLHRLIAHICSGKVFCQGLDYCLKCSSVRKRLLMRRLHGRNMRRRSRRETPQVTVGFWNKHCLAAGARISMVAGKCGNRCPYTPCHKTPRCYGRAWFVAAKTSYAGPVAISYNGVCQTQ